jgi:DNA-binding CsgD family transcriptional regulator
MRNNHMLPDTQLKQFYKFRLTPRQRQVVQLVSEGLANAEIARRLYIEPCVVAGHLTQIYDELSTLEALAHRRANRITVVRLFAGFFEQYPDLSCLD